jgi:hypothetical protein
MCRCLTVGMGMGMGMAAPVDFGMRIGVAIWVNWSHRKMLYYNITSVHKRPLQLPISGFQVKYRTTASPANRPAIEIPTEPST